MTGSGALPRALTVTLTARLAGVPRYTPGAPARRESGKLSANERMRGASPTVRAAVVSEIERLHLYPDPTVASQALADSLGVTTRELLLSNGSDETCQLLTQLVVGPGAPVVTSAPGYAMDEISAAIAGADVRRVPLVDGRHDVAGLIAASAGARVVWLPNPHNPTGTLLTEPEVTALAERIADGCLLVLDEAYRDFIEPHLAFDTSHWPRRWPHVVVQRSLSKGFGLAGLRIGYALAHPQLISGMRALQAPFAVNRMALAAAEACLADAAWQEQVCEATRQERDLLEQAVHDLGLDHFCSQGNFLTVRVDPDELAAELDLAGVVVRDGAGLGLPGYVRITIGQPSEMEHVRRALETVAAGNFELDRETIVSP